MRSTIKRGESVIVLGVAAALIALGVTGLGTFLAHAEEPEGTTHTEAATTEGGTLSDEVTAPDGLNVKVDTRGIDLPEGAVSAQYAIAVTADLAERTYGHPATGRAQAVLYNSETTYAPDYDSIHGLYWSVLLEVDGGTVSSTVVASTGVDSLSDFSPFSAGIWTQEFDAWDDSVASSGNYSTEQELRAFQDENPAPAPVMDTAQQAEARDRKIADAQEYAASVADEPHAAKAVEIVNERDLGNGATGVSGQIVTEGGGGPLDQTALSYYVVDVVLDNGEHLFVHIGQDDQALYGFERSAVDYLTHCYG